MSERVFLDANILVSAAWRSDNGLLALWELSDVTLLTSAYAIVEADRNVVTSEQRTRLHRPAQRLEIVDEPKSTRLSGEIRLPGKDVPILMAAIASGASVSNDPIGSMARLQLARALSASGDREKSAAVYKNLLALCA